MGGGAVEKVVTYRMYRTGIASFVTRRDKHYTTAPLSSTKYNHKNVNESLYRSAGTLTNLIIN